MSQQDYVHCLHTIWIPQVQSFIQEFGMERIVLDIQDAFDGVVAFLGLAINYNWPPPSVLTYVIKIPASARNDPSIIRFEIEIPQSAPEPELHDVLPESKGDSDDPHNIISV